MGQIESTAAPDFPWPRNAGPSPRVPRPQVGRFGLRLVLLAVLLLSLLKGAMLLVPRHPLEGMRLLPVHFIIPESQQIPR